MNHSKMFARLTERIIPCTFPIPQISHLLSKIHFSITQSAFFLNFFVYLFQSVKSVYAHFLNFFSS